VPSGCGLSFATVQGGHCAAPLPRGVTFAPRHRGGMRPPIALRARLPGDNTPRQKSRPRGFTGFTPETEALDLESAKFGDFR